MATAQSPNDLTRQQLDELDALLQKMLALPLNPPDGAAPAASSPMTSRPAVSELPLPEMPQSAVRSAFPPAYTPTPPAPASSGRETAQPVVWRGDTPSGSTAGPQLLTITAPSEPTPAPVTRKASSSPPRPAETSTPPPSKKEVPAGLILPLGLMSPASVPMPVQIPVASSQPVPSKSEPVPAILTPLVAFNRLLNFGLGQLGLPGRMLRSGFTKNLFGVAGLGLLAYTGAKIAQTQGWVTFPIELPWPT